MRFFEKDLTLWVALCIAAGIAVGQWLPAIPETLGRWEYANVSAPIAVLIWSLCGRRGRVRGHNLMP